MIDTCDTVHTSLRYEYVFSGEEEAAARTRRDAPRALVRRERIPREVLFCSPSVFVHLLNMCSSITLLVCRITGIA